MNSKQVGDAALAAVIASLVRLGETVLLPFGDKDRYDLVMDRGGKFSRVQVKNGRLENGVIEFNTCGNTTKDGKWVCTSYEGQIDYFGVYCPGTKECYLIPIEVCGEKTTRLRIDPAKNNRKKGTRLAKDFVL